MARQGTMDTSRSAITTADDAEDIEAELFFSTREMGVACFAVPESDVDEGADAP
jgi:hypothetical protein